MRTPPWPRAALLALLASGCTAGAPSDAPPAGASASPAGSAADGPSAGAAPERRAAPAPVREGGALVRAASGDALFVADEDHHALRRVALPLETGAAPATLEMPGPPAQALALGGRVLVTIRSPGLLLVVDAGADGAMREAARVALPADAWGVAITPDEKTAIVTSAWTHQVSAVDLGRAEVLWSVDVAREPRGVAVTPDGKTAYVSHLVGAALTRLDLGAAAPQPKRVALPAAPLRVPDPAHAEAASLGYALALSPDGRRLFAARHALGAVGDGFWWGAASVDVLLPGADEPLAPPLLDGKAQLREGVSDATIVTTTFARIVQPRAMVYRRSTQTLLVASEGGDWIAELDATAIDPAMKARHVFGLAGPPDERFGTATACGAPTGIALDENELHAFVFCRSTYTVARVALWSPETAGQSQMTKIAEDTFTGDARMGRRVFYNATDPFTSGGMGCAGCHPDGRDDGHVWSELKVGTASHPVFVASPELVGSGRPRQTPMLAGRVAAEGPYGWHAQNQDIVERIREGVRLHRISDPPLEWAEVETLVTWRARALAVFLRMGVAPPPRLGRELTPEEQRGRDLFKSAETACASCHTPETELTNRIAVPLPQPQPQKGFEADTNNAFKTPSLFFVGGTPPYFHDGRFSTLEELVSKNEDRMGKTNQLSEADRAALVAYLKTL